MTGRANQPDTPADRELRECIRATPPISFIMVAGAGSGKTTSLIKTLAAIVEMHGDGMRKRRQQVACITFTDIAAGEIWNDVGNNPLVHVSTIHSFLWTLIRPFQTDIRAWVADRIDERLAELREKAANFGPRVQRRTRDKNQQDIVRYEGQRAQIARVRSFSYGTGSDYPKGVLGHADIIRMVPQLLTDRPLLRTILAQKYPFVFVDESQDTAEGVVQALKAVEQHMHATFCLGFFGDPMQRIYLTGIGPIAKEPNWTEIKKPENFRCPSTVLAVANAVRKDGDGLEQTRGRMVEIDGQRQVIPGTARIFILPADDLRIERLEQVRRWIAERNNDAAWLAGAVDKSVKVLVIVHRMAATRLGFGDLYSAFNDKAPSAFKDGFLDASAWPLRPFISFALPVADAVRDGRDFEMMQLLRQHCPLLGKEKLQGVNVAARLSAVARHVDELAKQLADGSAASVRDVLAHLHATDLCALDERLVSYLDLAAPADDENDEEELTREIESMEAFLLCPAVQLWGYRAYVNEESPYSTQQGIKGAEFDRVLTVLDDDEGTHTQFSYDKYFGTTSLSDHDLANIREGKETAVDRTRRLFYVCCSRALQDLAVVFFARDVAAADRQVRASGFFPANAIHSLADVEGQA